MNKEVLIVAGLASKGSNLAPLKMLGELLSDSSQAYYIDGAEYVNGQLETSTPSMQLEKITNKIRSNPNNEYLIITQSLGAIAAVNALDSEYNIKARVLSISPPLPMPNKVLGHQRIKDIMSHNANRVTIPSYSFALANNGPSDIPPKPVDVIITKAYFDEIDQASNNFLEKMESAIQSGALQIVSPINDWNKEGISVAKKFNNTIYVDATHSLQTDQKSLKKICEYISKNMN